MPSVILSPGLLWSFRRWFVPLEPVGGAVHTNVHTNGTLAKGTASVGFDGRTERDTDAKPEVLEGSKHRRKAKPDENS